MLIGQQEEHNSPQTSVLSCKSDFPVIVTRIETARSAYSQRNLRSTSLIFVRHRSPLSSDESNVSIRTGTASDLLPAAVLSLLVNVHEKGPRNFCCEGLLLIMHCPGERQERATTIALPSLNPSSKSQRSGTR